VEEDHPVSSEVKSSLRSQITDAIIYQASLVDAKRANDSARTVAATVSDSNASTAPSMADSFDTTHVTKKRRSVLFTSYEKRREADSLVTSGSQSDSTSSAVLYYLSMWSSNSKVADPWAIFEDYQKLKPLKPLYERVFCYTASSCPVERVFSHTGFFIRPHRARMGKKLLCQLVFLKRNRHLSADMN
jgi:hypothetical protein